VMRRSVAGGIERFCANVIEVRAMQSKAAAIILLGIGDESYLRQDYRINKIYTIYHENSVNPVILSKTKGWPNGPPCNQTCSIA